LESALLRWGGALFSLPQKETAWTGSPDPGFSIFLKFFIIKQKILFRAKIPHIFFSKEVGDVHV